MIAVIYASVRERTDRVVEEGVAINILLLLRCAAASQQSQSVPLCRARARAAVRWFNVPYPFRRQEVHSFGDLIAEHNELVRRQRTRSVRVRVVVDAARIPQHALEFAQFCVFHDDEQGVCGAREQTKTKH